MRRLEVIGYRAPGGNFGDDLNDCLWKAVLPQSVLESDRLRLIGIGSILHDDFLRGKLGGGKQAVTLGSGVAYGPFTRGRGSLNFLPIAVRGPLSAAIVDAPGSAATDGAILLATPEAMNAFIPTAVPKKDVVFIPHHDSFQFSRWPEVCAAAGVTFVDPRRPPVTVLPQIAGARLVLAEAMHGAIVADTYRVPWRAIRTSGRVDAFKWHDWTASLNIPYEPVDIPVSSALDVLARKVDGEAALSVDVTDARLGFTSRTDAEEFYAAYQAQFHRQHPLPSDEMPPAGARPGTKPGGINGTVRRVVRRFAPVADRFMIDRAARALAYLAEEPGMLSHQAVFDSRLHRMVDAIRLIERIA